MTFESIGSLNINHLSIPPLLSEFDVMENWGVPTAVVFSDGKGVFDGAWYITTSRVYNRVLSKNQQMQVFTYLRANV